MSRTTDHPNYQENDLSDTATLEAPARTTHTWSSKARNGAGQEGFLSIQFTADTNDDKAFEDAVDRIAGLAQAAVFTRLGIKWEVGEDGVPRPTQATVAAATAAVQVSGGGSGGNGGGSPAAGPSSPGDFPRKIGESNGVEIWAKDGKYGPFVTDGTISASFQKFDTVDKMTVDRALKLIQAKRDRVANG